MSDIVKRLRAVRCGPVHEEAANAIEALEAEVISLRERLAEAHRMVKTYCADNERLEAANEAAEAEAARLREALSGIARSAEAATDLSLFRVQCRDFARAAIKGVEG